MSLTIFTNVASLNAQKNVTKNQNALAVSFERLSSGLRINSAKDDAAGLAISDRFTGQIRGYNQAIRNANDAVSLAQTAEGALGETTLMLHRLRELAIQAANGSNSATDRQALQEEAGALIDEIDRLATETTFNNRTILDGSFGSQTFHVGANANQTVDVSISSARVYALGAVASKTATVTGNVLAAGDLTINGTAIRATAAADDTLSSVDNDMSAIAKAAAINSTSADHGVTATALSTNVAAFTVAAAAVASGEIIINGVNIGAVTVLANDSDSALRNKINAHISTTGITAELNTSGNLVLTAGDGRNIDVVAAGGGAAAGFTTATTYGQVELQSDEDYTVGGTNEAYIGFANNDQVAVNTAVNISTITITTQSGANSSIGLIDTALRQVSSQRARLGAVLSRMSSAVSNLTTQSENLSAARSRIMDADFAQETAMFSRNQILQQASTSMLAQANVSGQVALSLLGGS